MKLYLLLLILLARTAVATAQTPPSHAFSLTGEVTGAQGKVLYLFYKDEKGKDVQDSLLLSNGLFTFTGRIDEPTMAVLRIGTENIPDDVNKNISQVFLEPTKMTARLAYNNFPGMQLTGSATHQEFRELNKQHDHINKTFTDSLYERHSRLTEDYILQHSNSYVSALELSHYRGWWRINTVQYLYARLTPRIRESRSGQEVKSFLDGLKANSEGHKAHDFIATDVRGRSLSLSSLKGKYVLLDFWGSWCKPCRASHPHLKELYAQYAAKGFEIVGVSTEYDKTDKAWKEAIQKDGIDCWYQVLSTPLAGSPDQPTKEIARLFAVHLFPTKILIDPSGFIIARVNGSDTEGRLDVILKTIYH